MTAIPNTSAKTSATVEIIPMEDGWWYDMRTGRNSITPDQPLKTRKAAIKHAEQTANAYGIHVSKIRDIDQD